MSEFDDDTALEPTADGWRGVISDRWSIRRGPNGGYVASFPLRARALQSPFPDPLTMTTHFLTTPSPGPVAVTVETLRVGRSHATLEGRLHQDKPVAVALATFGTLADKGPESVQAEMPAVSPPDASSRRLSMPPHDGLSVRDRLDQRVPAEGDVMTEPGSGGPARVGGWTRLVDRDLDALAVPLFMDTWPPSMFASMGSGLAPTIELTVHWRSRPRTPWHLALFRSRFLMSGYVEEDGELWGEDGRLVAQSRQLALFLPGEAADARPA